VAFVALPGRRKRGIGGGQFIDGTVIWTSPTGPDLSDLTGRGRPFPAAAARAGVRATGLEQTKPLTATKRSNCSGAQA
jgi:hypothetical protein